MKGNIEELTKEELSKSLIDTKEEVRQQRFKSVTGKVENPKLVKELKRKIARIKTVMRQNELQAENNK